MFLFIADRPLGSPRPYSDPMFLTATGADSWTLTSGCTGKNPAGPSHRPPDPLAPCIAEWVAA